MLLNETTQGIGEGLSLNGEFGGPQSEEETQQRTKGASSED